MISNNQAFILILLTLISVIWLYCYMNRSLFNDDTNIVKSPLTAVDIQFIQNYININKDKNSSSIATTTITNANMKSVKHKPRFYIPKYMLDLYEESRIIPQHEILLKNHPDIVKSIIPKNAVSFTNNSFPRYNNEKSHLLIFDVPVTNADEIFLAAELRILSIIQPHLNSTFGIERMIHVSFYDYIDNNVIHLDKKHIYHTNNTWISFNLTSAINHILTNNYTQQLRVVITIETFHMNSASVSTHTDKNVSFNLSLLPISRKYHYEHDYPLLLLSYTSIRHQSHEGYQHYKRETTQQVHQRYKRDTSEFVEDEYEEETNHLWNDQNESYMKPAHLKRLRRLRNTCKRQSLYVNFADINYDSWIVQPTGYEAYQCSGKCFYPVADHLSPTKHAIIQALLHSVHPRTTPRTCCVPTKLGPISVLYVDSRGILTYRYGYQEMVVLDCGCR